MVSGSEGQEGGSLPDNDNDNDLMILADAAIARLGLVEAEPFRQVSASTLSPLLEKFIGGKISQYAQNWEKLTTDSKILSIVQHGVVFHFVDTLPQSKPFTIGVSPS